MIKKECNYSEKLIFLVVQTRKWFRSQYYKMSDNIDIPYFVSADSRTK